MRQAVLDICRRGRRGQPAVAVFWDGCQTRLALKPGRKNGQALRGDGVAGERAGTKTGVQEIMGKAPE